MKRVNLLPTEVRERRRARAQQAGLVVAGLAIVALLAVIWVLRQGVLNNEEDRLAAAESQIRELESRRLALKEFGDLEAAVISKEQTLATVMADDIHWSRILTELSMVIPEESWLTAFNGSAEAPGAAAAAPPPGAAAQPAAPKKLGTLNFTAVTFEFPDVAKWIIRLQGLKSLQNVWVPSATRGEIGGREVVNFTSTTELSTTAASGRYQPPGAAR